MPREVLHGGMDMSPASLFTSLLVSGVGYVLFSYGRKASRFPHLATGIALFVSSWVAPTPLVSVLIAAALLLVLWVVVKRMGY